MEEALRRMSTASQEAGASPYVDLPASGNPADRHEEYRAWLAALINGPAPYAVSDHAVAGMIRIVTNCSPHCVGSRRPRAT
jgi:hypothetical protein